MESVLCRKAMLQMPTFQAIVCGVFIFQHKFVNKKKYVGKSRTLYRGTCNSSRWYRSARELEIVAEV